VAINSAFGQQQGRGDEQQHIEKQREGDSTSRQRQCLPSSFRLCRDCVGTGNRPVPPPVSPAKSPSPSMTAGEWTTAAVSLFSLGFCFTERDIWRRSLSALMPGVPLTARALLRAHYGQLEKGRACRSFWQASRSVNDRAVSFAHRNGIGVRCAHHYALNHALPARQLNLVRSAH